MKKKLSCFLFFILMTAAAFGKIWTVGNSGATYTPSTVTVVQGDTIDFTPISNSHDVREVSQATWNTNGNTPLPGGFSAPWGGGMVFSAQLSAGTHWYVCTPHASMGMKGRIIVQPCTIPEQPAAIVGTSTVCAGSAINYTIDLVSGATSYSWKLPNGWTGTSTTNSITATAGASSGDITVAAINACGSSATQNLAVTANVIDASVEAMNDTLMAGESAATYQWLDCNSQSPIGGATDRLFITGGNGSYAVAIAKSGCTDTSACIPIAVGLGDPDTRFFEIAPNPSNGVFHISVNGNTFYDNSEWEVYNTPGDRILSGQWSRDEQDKTIDLSQFAPGIYFIRVLAGETSSIWKVVRQ